MVLTQSLLLNLTLINKQINTPVSLTFQTLDEEEPYTDEEFQRYEHVMAEHEQRFRQQPFRDSNIQCLDSY